MPGGDGNPLEVISVGLSFKEYRMKHPFEYGFNEVKDLPSSPGTPLKVIPMESGLAILGKAEPYLFSKEKVGCSAHSNIPTEPGQYDNGVWTG